MKLVYFSHCELREGMASTVHLRGIAANLRAYGAEVTVICRKDKEARLESWEVPVPFVNLKGLRTISFTLLANLKLLILCLKLRPDAIYCRRMLLDPFPALVAGLTGTPLILELNETPDPHVRELRPRLLWEKIIGAVEAVLVRSAAGVSCPSEGMRRYYAEKYPEKAGVLSVVYHGVDTEIFFPEDRAASQRRLGLAPGVYALWAGTSFWWSGLDFIGEMARELEKAGAGVKILVLGGGAEVERLKTSASGRFVFHPGLPHAEMRFAYCAASLLLAPYAAEIMQTRGFPFKVIESLACATPVVMAPSPVAQEVKSVLGGVMIAEKGTAASWAACAACVVADQEKAGRPGAEGREGILKTGMTWASAARATMKILEGAAS